MKLTCAILGVGFFALIIHDSAVRAQSDSPSKKAISSTAAESRTDQTKRDRTSSSDQERIDEMFAQCLKDWDAKTHMTKREWTRVCRRVVDDRTKYYKQDGGDLSSVRR